MKNALVKRIRARARPHAVAAGRIDELGAVEALASPGEWAAVEAGEAEEDVRNAISPWTIATR